MSPATVAPNRTILPQRMQWSEPPLVFTRMSLEDFFNLPEKPKSEWVDGWAIIMNAAMPIHQRLIYRLLITLSTALQTYDILPDVGVQLSSSYRRPDISIFRHEVSGKHSWIQESPTIVIEVLSPSTRRQDLVAKAAEYSEVGIKQYWQVDPQMRKLTVLANNDGTWIETHLLTDDHPTADIRVGEHEIVHLDLNELLP